MFTLFAFYATMVGLKLRLSGSDAVFRNFKRAMGHPLARPDVFDYYLMEEKKLFRSLASTPQ